MDSTLEKAEHSRINFLPSLAREPLEQILKHSPPSIDFHSPNNDKIKSGSNLKTITSENIESDIPTDSESNPKSNFVNKDTSSIRFSATKALTRSAVHDFSTPDSQKGKISISSVINKTPLMSNQDVPVSSNIVRNLDSSVKNQTPNKNQATPQSDKSSSKTLEDSDNEIFYSPCSINSSGVEAIPENTGKSSNLFGDLSLLENKFQEDIQDSKAEESSFKKSSLFDVTSKSRKTFVFTRNTSATGNVSTSLKFGETQLDKCLSSSISDTKADSIKKDFSDTYSTKPSRKTFVFTRSSTIQHPVVTDTTVSTQKDGHAVESVDVESNTELENILDEGNVKQVSNSLTNKCLETSAHLPGEHKLNVMKKSNSDFGNKNQHCDAKLSGSFTFSKPFEPAIHPCFDNEQSSVKESIIIVDDDVNVINKSAQSFPNQGKLKTESKTFLFSDPIVPTFDRNLDDKCVKNSLKSSHQTYIVPESSIPSSSSKTESTYSSNMETVKNQSSDDNKFLVPGEVKKTTRKTFVFGRTSTNPCSTSADSSILSQSSFTNSSVLSTTVTVGQDKKPANKTFVFGRSSNNINTTSDDTGTKIKTPSSSIHDSGLVSSLLPELTIVGQDKKPSRKTFVFTRRTDRSAISTDSNVEIPVTSTLSVLDDTASAVLTESIASKQDKKSTRETFVIKPSSNIDTSSTVLTESSIVNQDKKPTRETFVIKPSSNINTSTSTVLTESTAVNQDKKSSRETFVIKPNSNMNTTSIDTSAKFTVTSSDQDSNTDSTIISVNQDKKPSRKTFVFGRSKESKSSTQISSEESLKDSVPETIDENVKKDETVFKEEVPCDESLKDSVSKKADENVNQDKKPTRKTFVFGRSTVTRSSTQISSEESLKDFVPEKFDENVKKTVNQNKKPSRKTFVFGRSTATRNSAQTYSGESLKDSLSKNIDENVKKDETVFSDKVNFLEASEAETYEEFSSSLAKNAPFKQNKDNTMNLQSSPHVSSEKESATLNAEISNETQEITPQTVKKASQSKQSGSVLKSKKKTTRGKVAKKLEFSFSEPHSPATPDVLEALSKAAKTPEQSLPSFMFSPPLTRGRLRQKKLDETMGSSFSSVTSEVYFATEKRPPMDPILEGIIKEKSLQTKKSVKKRTVQVSTSKRILKKAKLQDSVMDITDQSFLSLNQSTSQRKAPASPRHNMTLRQTRAKQTDSSFL